MKKKFQITDYDIVFSGLKEGEHNYVFKISDTFLKNFGFNELNNVDMQVNSIFVKKNSLMELNLNGKGSYILTCDISNEEFLYRVDSKLNYIINGKFI